MGLLEKDQAIYPCVGNPGIDSFLSDAITFVDFLNGNDINRGTTPATALATPDEWTTRIGEGRTFAQGGPAGAASSGARRAFTSPPELVLLTIPSTGAGQPMWRVRISAYLPRGQGIPAGGLPLVGALIVLPPGNEPGDAIEIVDEGGSCGPDAPVLIGAAGSVGISIDGQLTVALSQPGFSVSFTWTGTIWTQVGAGSTTVPGIWLQAGNTWFVDRVNGGNGASGLALANPLQTFAEIRRRWMLATPSIFVRPRLPSGTTTVTLVKQAATQPDLADPVDVLFDVDGADGAKLVVIGANPVASRSGVLATASAFARTNAAGRQTITDGGVADFSPFVNQLFHDKTSGAISWLCLPLAASATGTLSGQGRAALTAGTFSSPAPVAVAAADQYELLPLLNVYMRGGWTARGSVDQSLGGFNIFMYRLTARTTAGTDIMSARLEDGAFFNGQESRFDQNYDLTGGQNLQWNFTNCAFPNTAGQHLVEGVELFSGYGRGLFAFGGAYESIVDGDFAFDEATGSNGQIVTQTGVGLDIGNCSVWRTSGPALLVGAGQVIFGPLLEAAGVFYGTVGAANAVIWFLRAGGRAVYPAGAGNAAATFKWDSNVTNWTFGITAFINGFGFNAATGAIVGPTANTWAHLDAALAAGTGFGGGAANGGAFWPPDGTGILNYL